MYNAVAGGRVLYHNFVRVPLSHLMLYSLPSNQRAYTGHKIALVLALTFL